LVACSGGADSTALAAAVATGFRAAVGHVDHGLRAESGRDAEAVRELAESLGLPFWVERIEGLDPRGQGLEAAARQARYPALARLARRAGATMVLTAHTRRDQAETVLLRLIRGAGPGALSGVRRRRPLAEGIELLRPLLDVPRAATEAYCRERGLRFLHDPHNADPARARARLRALWPALLELNPRRGGLRFAAGRRPRPLPPVAVAIEGPGSYSLNARELVVRAEGEGTPVDLDRAPFPWVLRQKRPGDRFRPAAGRTRKVSDWLADARVPVEDRDTVAVLEDARGEVFFVEGLRESPALREGKATARFSLVRK
jgi:tRNA(Ile)-lysidine synthetase-like protein